MLIVLEGCDGSGKTTLRNELLRHCTDEVVVFHQGPFPEGQDVGRVYERDLDFYYPGCGVDVICDRWHWGETIYGPLYRGKSQLSELMLEHVDLYLLARGAHFLHLTAEPEELIRRQRREGEDFLKEEHVLQVHAAYEALANRPHQRLALTYHTDQDELNPARIVALARAKERLSQRLAKYPSYVGPRYPRVLLLGERVNSSRTRPEGQAAFFPYPETSGSYLLRALRLGDVSAYGFANQVDLGQGDLVRDLHNPYVVALGRVAQAACVKHGIEHQSIPHPQFWRRFRHSSLGTYADLLVQAASGRLREDPYHSPSAGEPPGRLPVPGAVGS